MTDEHEEYEVFHADPEEIEEIVNWAIATAAMVTLMQHEPIAETPEEKLERLEGFIEAVDIMYTNIPDCLVPVAHEVASDSIEDAAKEQTLVDELLEEIKDW